jgi:hypothetical protein
MDHDSWRRPAIGVPQLPAPVPAPEEVKRPRLYLQPLFQARWGLADSSKLSRKYRGDRMVLPYQPILADDRPDLPTCPLTGDRKREKVFRAETWRSNGGVIHTIVFYSFRTLVQRHAQCIKALFKRRPLCIKASTVDDYSGKLDASSGPLSDLCGECGHRSSQATSHTYLQIWRELARPSQEPPLR